jgi:hypothetical protein
MTCVLYPSVNVKGTSQASTSAGWSLLFKSFQAKVAKITWQKSLIKIATDGRGNSTIKQVLLSTGLSPRGKLPQPL